MQFDNLVNENVYYWLSANKQGTVVFLIDMQVSEYSPNMDLSQADLQRLLANQKNVLKICAGMDIPVVLIELEHDGRTSQELLVLFYRLRPERRKEIIKSGADAFIGTHLERLVISELGRNKVLATGISAEKCVKETVIHSLELGLRVYTGWHFIANYYYQPQNYMGWYEAQNKITLI